MTQSGNKQFPQPPLGSRSFKVTIIEDRREIREGLSMLIYEKLEVHSKSTAVAKALRNRLLH